MATAAAPVLAPPDRSMGGNISWAPTFDILSSLPPGASREVAVPQGVAVEKFVALLRSNIFSNPRTQHMKFLVRAGDNDTVWVKRLTKLETHAKQFAETSEAAERRAPRVSRVMDTALATLLLGKLPDFNPDWTDSVKESWFGTYEEVARMLVFLSPNGQSVIK